MVNIFFSILRLASLDKMQLREKETRFVCTVDKFLTTYKMPQLISLAMNTICNPHYQLFHQSLNTKYSRNIEIIGMSVLDMTSAVLKKVRCLAHCAIVKKANCALFQEQN
jgi:hypothetical protein